MPLLRTTPLVQLLLHMDTSSPLSPVLCCSAYFSALPTLYTPHSFCVPHPLQFSICCHLRSQVLNWIHFLFSITCIRPPLPYLEHRITLLLPTLTLNFLLSHTIPNSLTSLHNFSESATSLFHLQITAGSSQTCHHSHLATPALSQGP